MKHDELVKVAATRAKMPVADCDKAVRAMLGTMVDQLAAHGSVNMIGLGKFSTRINPAHKARNPRTGAAVQVPEKIKVSFKASKVLRRSL